MQGHRRYLTIILTFLTAALANASATNAESNTCRQLEAQLVQLSATANPKLAKKYDNAILRQGKQIEIARKQASLAGCGFLLFGSHVGRCAEINGALERMNTNLDSLHEKRANLSRRPSQRQARSRIEAALSTNGCGKKQVTIIRSSQSKGNNDAQDSHRKTDIANPTLNKGVVIRRSGNGYARLDAEYRTVCVRTCDGYFFPMSSTASVANFQRDQARCEAACPRTNIEMFYSGEKGDENKMISSVTGNTYEQLPNAFFFKRLDITREPSCGCGAPKDASLFGNAPIVQPQNMVSQPGSSIVEVLPTVPSDSTPNASINVTPVERELDEDSSVRVVGPKFLPGLEEAIDLQAPAQQTTP